MKSFLLATLLRHRNATLLTLALATVVASAHAGSIVVNGGFESTSQPGVSAQFGTGYAQQVTDWTTSGYNFVFTPGAADTTGATGQYGALHLWGPNNGGAASNHLPATSPNGGNYLAMDGAYEVEPVSQTLFGLTPGKAATVSFFYAGAQQSGYTGATTEQLIVSLGGQSFATPVLQNVDHGFTGWYSESFTFTPTSSSEVLSFLAVGTPNGEPPFTLLDGVSVSQTPEPSSLALLITGLTGVGGMVRNRFRKNAI
jgi:hypothetical protein